MNLSLLIVLFVLAVAGTVINFYEGMQFFDGNDEFLEGVFLVLSFPITMISSGAVLLGTARKPQPYPKLAKLIRPAMFVALIANTLLLAALVIL